MRTSRNAAPFALLLVLAGCGSGGGGASAPAPSSSPPQLPAATNTIATSGPNVQPIVVNSGVANTVDVAYTTVTICLPGSAICQTIDNVVVDTASTGLRIMSSLLPASLFLPQQTDATGNPIVECTQFASGYSWGPVKIADVKIAGETASAVAIQVIGDPGFAAVPASCSRIGPARDTVQTFGANGVLGVGVFRHDCGNACALSSSLGFYFVCPPSASCRPAVVSLVQQVQNPVALFAIDNNGVIVELPPVGPNGAASITGSLVFGIGTQANNGLGAATVLTVDPGTAAFTTIFSNLTFTASFMDSGSNAFYFQNTGTPLCSSLPAPGFYCPSATQNLAATIQGRNGATAAVDFSVASANSLLTNNPNFTAFNNLAAPQLFPNSFDWGLPFFFGRNVFTAIEGANTPGGTGPYIAF
jgi:hypothetical protein